jgi:sulfur carrier protein ThiS
MRIRVKLMGVLKTRTPEGAVLEVADGATIDDVLQALALAPQMTHVVTVNGQLERNRRHALAPDDELTVVPPVGGG